MLNFNIEKRYFLFFLIRKYGIFSKSEYSRTPTRELEIDTTCSICGNSGVVKYRSVKGTNSFVCMNCRQLYNREQRGDLPKEVESYNPITVMQ